MKKALLLSVAVMCLCTYVKAQEDVESKYIRNSLYMLKLDMEPDDEEYAHAFEVMNKTFDGIDFAKRYERYNDFSLAGRHIDWTNIPTVTSAEMDAIEKESKKDKLIKEELEKLGVKVDPISEREYAARILKYFNENNFANQLVAKWHTASGTDPKKVSAWDMSTILELGMKGLSEEERANAKATENLTAVSGSREAENICRIE